MYPFSFDEFLKVQGYYGLFKEKKEASEFHPLSEPLRQKLIEQIRYFHLTYIDNSCRTCECKFRYSWLSQEYENRQIKLALEMLTMAGLIIPVTHSSANGQPLGAEINEKFRKYIFIDTGLLLRFHHFQTEDILLSPPSDFVNKGNLAEGREEFTG